MSKNFDAWNNEKKQINESRKNKYYHEREIWWCSLGINIGFEQDGTGKEYQRPVLVLRGFSSHVCLVVPLTTSPKDNPYHIPVGVIGDRLSFAITSQIRLIDTKRFINKIAVIQKSKFEKIKKAVRDLI